MPKRRRHAGADGEHHRARGLRVDEQPAPHAPITEAEFIQLMERLGFRLTQVQARQNDVFCNAGCIIHDVRLPNEACHRVREMGSFDVHLGRERI